MNLVWTPKAWEDYLHWQAADKKILKRINALIKDTRRTPLKGIGKPEPLRGNLTGWWSRRVTGDHRLVYRVKGNPGAQVLEIGACRYHY